VKGKHIHNNASVYAFSVVLRRNNKRKVTKKRLSKKGRREKEIHVIIPLPSPTRERGSSAPEKIQGRMGD
jgi:hypothetical protein